MNIVIRERSADVAILTLNRPDSLNALNSELIDALLAELTALAKDCSLRCLIVTGAGDKAFCAGADLKERLAMTPEQRTDHTRRINTIADALAEFPVPVIAALRGFVLAGGAELAVACDLRVMGADVQFGLPEVKIGVFPGAGATIRLPAIVGSGRARDLLFTGRRINAEEALSIGLASRVVVPDEVLATSLAISQQISEGAPLAIRALKDALNSAAGLPSQDAARIVARLRVPLDATSDYTEGLRAFSERRPPHFTGN